MKRKFLWLYICIGIFVFVTAGLISALVLSTPSELTPEETQYYTEIAENMWYNGLNTLTPDANINIAYDLNAKTVTISTHDTTKQSITVNFAEEPHEVIINTPESTFLGSFIFYGFLWTLLLAMFGSIFVPFVQTIIENRSRKGH